MPISLRMRYGIQTIVIMVDPLAPFSAVTDELIFALGDRFEPGLKLRPDDDPHDVPTSAANVHVAYAVLNDPNDSEKGWKNLHIQGDETAASLGLKNNALLSFVIRRKDEADEEPDFNEVSWPGLGEEEEDDEGDAMEEDGEETPARADKGKGKAVENGDENVED